MAAVVSLLFPLLISAGQLPNVDGVELIEVVGGLGGIVAIAHAEDDRLFLVGQDGLIWILTDSLDGSVLPTPFLDLTALVGSGFEQGLLSLAFHPSYETNGFFYVFYSAADDDDPVIARYEVSSDDPDIGDGSSGVILLDMAHFGGHYGSHLEFGPDSYLYFTLGDGGQQNDPSCRAQDLSLLQGKMHRIDVDTSIDTPPYHGIPADNPFVGPGDPPDSVWSIGFRNPWRFSFDSLTGDLFISDVGQNTREEVSFQSADSTGGENYGWKLMEGTSCFDPDPIDADCPAGTPSCFDASFTMPIIEYDHSQGECSITGGFVYRGPRAPELEGAYLYGDWCTGRLWSSHREGDDWASQELPVSLAGIRTFGQDRSGNAFATDGSTLYRIEGSQHIFSDGFESGGTGAWSATVSP